MSKKIQKVIILVLVLLMIAGVALPLFTSSIVHADTVEEIQSRLEQAEKQLEAIKVDEATIKKNLAAEVKKLEQYEQEIADAETQISKLTGEIEASELIIEGLQRSIDERQKKIDEIELKVKQYMITAQSTSHVNGYFEFVMEGSDFSQIVRRLEGMSAIKRYNEGLVREITEAKIALEKDRQKQLDEKKAIELRKEEIEIGKKEKEALQEKVRIVVVELRQKEEEAELQIQAINAKNEQDKALIERLSMDVPSGGGNGFTLPLPSGSFDITASVWAYPAEYGGSPHMGVDLGANRGTPVYAVGPGVILTTNSGCYEGSWSCGGGYGNYISYLVNVNGRNYGIVIAHLSSVNASPNQRINAGDVIAYSGNTGISSGAHLHIETIDMGSGSLLQGWSRWNGQVQFGTGSASSGGRRCDQGYGVPCRLNPRSTLGI